MSQNYENHVRWSVPYHFVTIPIIMLASGYAAYTFYETPDGVHGLLFLAFILLGIVVGFARFFALKVQDRAARADERLRYYILAGEMLPLDLKMGQILALRFASDKELVALAQRVSIEKLSPKEIKQAVKTWRGDYHRI